MGSRVVYIYIWDKGYRRYLFSNLRGMLLSLVYRFIAWR
jgi:hypothetical protein